MARIIRTSCQAVKRPLAALNLTSQFANAIVKPIQKDRFLMAVNTPSSKPFQKKSILVLAGFAILFFLISTGSGGLFLYHLYQKTLDTRIYALFEETDHQIQDIQNALKSFYEGNSATSRQDILRRKLKAHAEYQHFDQTGVVIFVYSENEAHDLYIGPSTRIPSKGDFFPGTSNSENPFQLALQGASGSSQLVDYRGESVIVAYRHSGIEGLAAVSMLDMAEIRAPYFRTVFLSLSLGIPVLLIMSLWLVWLLTGTLPFRGEITKNVS